MSGQPRNVTCHVKLFSFYSALSDTQVRFFLIEGGSEIIRLRNFACTTSFHEMHTVLESYLRKQTIHCEFQLDLVTILRRQGKTLIKLVQSRVSTQVMEQSVAHLVQNC
jgi:hypothetical protein